MLKKQKKINYLITKYKNIEKELIHNECNQNNTVELWYICLYMFFGFQKKKIYIYILINYIFLIIKII